MNILSTLMYTKCYPFKKFLPKRSSPEPLLKCVNGDITKINDFLSATTECKFAVFSKCISAINIFFLYDFLVNRLFFFYISLRHLEKTRIVLCKYLNVRVCLSVIIMYIICALVDNRTLLYVP